MTSTRARKLTFTVLSTAILMAVVAALIFATPNSALAAEPERPTDLTATAVDHDTVSLSWSHPDPATVDHYQVLSRTVGAGTGLLQVGTSTTTSFEHDGLEPESTYIYRVKPINSAGEQGKRSARAEATTPAEETPAPEPDPTPAPPQRSDDEGKGNIARAASTGKPGITGAAQVGMTLTAGTADIADPDGLNTPGYTYQWLRAGSNISGATSSTYTLTSSDYAETIQVKVDFTDDGGNADRTIDNPADGDYQLMYCFNAYSIGSSWSYTCFYGEYEIP